MLSSITPLGERGRGNRWAVTAGAFALGALAGGATTGAVLGSIGQLLLDVLPADPVAAAPRLLVLAVAAGIGALADLGAGGLRVVSSRRQVDEAWIGRYRGWVYGAGFGYQLGAGAVTVVTSAATWVALVAMALTGSTLAGMLVGLTFGAARAAPLTLAAGIHTPIELTAVHRRNRSWEPVARRSAVGGQVLVSLAAAVCALVVWA
ncbi:MAG: hypothetical protein HYX34_16150 [Actinobacteria bacterium]|nr:hypothetical protein [Actinomycetota bacterium]